MFAISREADEVFDIMANDDDPFMIFECLIPVISSDKSNMALIPRKKKRYLKNKSKKKFFRK